MWVKKLPSEIKRNKKSYFNPKWPLIYALGIFLVCAVSIKLGFSKYDIPSINPITWNDFFSWGIKKALWMALLFGLIFYFWQILTKRQLSTVEPMLICEKCHKIKNYDTNLECECGGHYIELNEMKWVNNTENI